MKMPCYFSFTALVLCHSKLPSLNTHLETNYTMIQNTKSKYNADGRARRRESDCRHSEKRPACWNFTQRTTEQAYLNLFSCMNYTWLSSPNYTPRGKNILNDNLLISCQTGKIHSLLRICSWFLLIFVMIFCNALGVTFDFLGRNKWQWLIPVFTSTHDKFAHVGVKTKGEGLLSAHVPGPAGKPIQVFACRKALLIRERTRPGRPVCRYLQVQLLKRQDCGMTHAVSGTGKVLPVHETPPAPRSVLSQTRCAHDKVAVAPFKRPWMMLIIATPKTIIMTIITKRNAQRQVYCHSAKASGLRFWSRYFPGTVDDDR